MVQETPVRCITVASSRKETDLAEMLTKDGWLHNRNGFLEHQFKKWLPNNLGRKALGGSAMKVAESLGSTVMASGVSTSEKSHPWNVLELRLQTCQPRVSNRPCSQTYGVARMSSVRSCKPHTRTSYSKAMDVLYWSGQ